MVQIRESEESDHVGKKINIVRERKQDVVVEYVEGSLSILISILH